VDILNGKIRAKNGFIQKNPHFLTSQMLAVWIFNFAALVLTKLLLYGCILSGSRFMVSSFPPDFNMASMGFYIQLLVKSVVILHCFVYWYGNEIIKGNDYFFFSVDNLDTGKHRRPNNSK